MKGRVFKMKGAGKAIVPLEALPCKEPNETYPRNELVLMRVGYYKHRK